MISTLVPSLLRTYTPIVVGAFISWLITLGVTLDPSVEQGLTVALTGLLIAVYYTVVRLLEKRWPFFSVLLGSSQMPAIYSPRGEDGVIDITTLPARSPVEPPAPGYPGGPF